MVTNSAILVTFISVLLLSVKCGGAVVTRHLQSTVHHTNNEHSGYHQAIAVPPQCHYILRETESFINLTVASHGCFVRRQKYHTHLPVVIMGHAEKGRLEIEKRIHVICERKIKEMKKFEYPLVSGNHFCSKDGFNINISQNATVPHLDLDALWVPSGLSANCKPQKRSKEAVTFNFPFTDCGTQYSAGDGIIKYWVKVEVKQHPQKGSIFRNTPFSLTVHCSFMLAQITQLGLNIEQEKFQDPFTLKSEGILSTGVRFAKDPNYRTFYSSRDPPVVKLGLPVYVDIYVLKHEDRDLVLLLEDCWATPTKNPHDKQRWDLLVKGCPFSGDSHMTVVLPVVSSKEMKYPSLHKWMAFKLFSFVKSQSDENLVYLHCDIKFCKGPDCSQSCSNERRKTRWITPQLGQSTLFSVVSGGPLLYLM
ncbi:zona pellucida sperm-binding protein 4-like isoform X2 [Notolabrus celidotus]|uniref:zona pellucida sperm-binding protein 4-like isoform X2 n=1 Tax=Notolabrus celidotus TaxID=1203425 RepID=UPI0014906CEA|nr:zona pellucida sperm-binding protein 4-like isoform X2 [Notolabrus celidotus]